MKKNIDATGFWNTIFGKKAKSVQEGDFPTDFHTDEGKEYYSNLKDHFAVTDYIEPDESIANNDFEEVDPLALPVSVIKQNHSSVGSSNSSEEDDASNQSDSSEEEKCSYPKKVLEECDMKNCKVVITIVEPKCEQN